MRHSPRTRLEQRAQAEHLSVSDFVDRFHLAAREAGELLHVSERQAKRWLAGQAGLPRPAACRVLECWWGEPVERLLAAPTEQGLPWRSVTITEEALAMAADRARDFALAAQAMSGEALGMIFDEVRALAQAYPRRPLPELVGRMVEVQDVAFRLLEDRGRPADARQLYLLAGVACGLLAKASHDLAEPHAAMTQSRTAYVCAEQADHAGLKAWVRGLQALIAYWAGRPAESMNYARAGAEFARASGGTTTTWLPVSEARALAAQGDADAALAAIRAAEDAIDQVRDDDLDQLGGMCTFARARMDYYAADALSWLPQKPADAGAYAVRAVAAYSHRSAEDWAFGDMAGAHSALAVSRIRSDDMDGAAEALDPVFALRPEERINGIVASVQRVHRALQRRGPFPESRGLAERIELFTRTPAAALPR